MILSLLGLAPSLSLSFDMIKEGKGFLGPTGFILLLLLGTAVMVWTQLDGLFELRFLPPYLPSYAFSRAKCTGCSKKRKTAFSSSQP